MHLNIYDHIVFYTHSLHNSAYSCFNLVITVILMPSATVIIDFCLWLVTPSKYIFFKQRNLLCPFTAHTTFVITIYCLLLLGLTKFVHFGGWAVCNGFGQHLHAKLMHCLRLVHNGLFIQTTYHWLHLIATEHVGCQGGTFAECGFLGLCNTCILHLLVCKRVIVQVFDVTLEFFFANDMLFCLRFHLFICLFIGASSQALHTALQLLLGQAWSN